jgi:hypothetical protein
VRELYGDRLDDPATVYGLVLALSGPVGPRHGRDTIRSEVGA